MRSVLLAAVAAVAFASMPAGAVTYRLVNPVRDAATAAIGAQVPSFELQVSDAAVRRGQFTYSVLGGFDYSSATGDVADFISASAFGVTTAPATPGLHGSFTASITFDANGTVSGSRLSLMNFNGDFEFGGSGTSLTGVYGGDAGSGSSGSCGARNNPCRMISGELVRASIFIPSDFTAVPEPATMAILAMGLLGTLAARRRHVNTTGLPPNT